MFLLDKNTLLTPSKIGEIIQKYETMERPKLTRYLNYYKGKQDILLKTVTDSTKPNNKIVTNYCYNIVQNYLGYLTGKDITYTSELDISEIQDILNYNDVRNTDSELLKNALIYGRAFEISYLDEQIQQRFKVLDSRECIPVYDNTINKDLLCVIRYYRLDEYDITSGYVVEVYDGKFITSYKSNSAYSALNLIGQAPHYYGQVPITVFSLNADEESIFDKIMTLQDSYNTLLSAEVDDFQAFCDAYLMLRGCTADSSDIQMMKENRVLILDADADAAYVNKSINDTQIENMLKNLNDAIHKIANSPDFNDEKFMAASGIAMKYKLVGFENASSAIQASMTKALQRRIELMCSILSLTGLEAVWRDIEITFTRNLPANDLETAQVINTLRGMVSNKTLISQLSFVTDIDKEMAQIEQENAQNAALYTFDTGSVAE